ncbi:MULTISPECIES: NERD domain-containing protein [unclassified Bacillus (in: firmicutes)]|uniref:NERD domain-containing protein n=1 Tax=unclassified Bacillus (in: firmicutes) TaxID=185979 RepID=UPI001BEBD834|nr:MULTISPECIES: NERD domain-containing protein [unclassified Bacillus (in: firmicutes)]MBT2638426.1 NERD domain-containing protein [Bacillus sp. ISL-39]MBT2662209.1 NERD domain-containing protein [Bacillus sp. ISL-45]
MAQLIKLQDYVSRYAQDIYLYPSRYVRLKKKQWEGIREKWENSPEQTIGNHFDIHQEEEPNNFLHKLKSMVRQPEPMKEESFREDQDQLMDDGMLNSISNLQSIEELKQHFLDGLLPFQLKWASSTLTERSFIAKEFVSDPTLKFLLQRFPDTFLILYKPIFLLKKAPVEAELIIITPAAAMCIAFIEAEENAAYVGSKDRFWIKKTRNKEKKILNPLIALNRTEKIVKTLFDMYGVELPVQKLLISRNGFIDYPLPPYGVQFIEKRNFEDWFMALRGMKSPLKHMQLKAAQVLLQYGQTTSVRRLEWENNSKSEQ